VNVAGILLKLVPFLRERASCAQPEDMEINKEPKLKINVWFVLLAFSRRCRESRLKQHAPLVHTVESLEELCRHQYQQTLHV
jgi:hypothetical protein